MDRVYCVERTPTAKSWGALDDWRKEAAQNTSVAPWDFAGDNAEGGLAWRFHGDYPFGSAMAQLYDTSWGINKMGPCRDPGSREWAVGPARDTCVVTKLFESCEGITHPSHFDRPAEFAFGCGCVGRCDSATRWEPTARCDYGGGSGPGAAAGWPPPEEGVNPAYINGDYANVSKPWPANITCAWTKVVPKSDKCCSNLFAGYGNTGECERIK
jgi:hypothetical protein